MLCWKLTTQKKLSLLTLRKSMEPSSTSSTWRASLKGAAKSVFRTKPPKKIHLSTLAIAKAHAALFIWDVSKTGLTTKSKRSVFWKLELTTLKNSLAKSVKLRSQRWFDSIMAMKSFSSTSKGRHPLTFCWNNALKPKPNTEKPFTLFFQKQTVEWTLVEDRIASWTFLTFQYPDCTRILSSKMIISAFTIQTVNLER